MQEFIKQTLEYATFGETLSEARSFYIQVCE